MKHVHSLVDVFEKYGNPFTEESQDLILSDSRDKVGYYVTETISNIQRIERTIPSISKQLINIEGRKLA